MNNSGWDTTTLEEAIDGIIDYRGKTPEKTTSGIPLITAKIVKDGFIQTPTEFIAESNYDNWMVKGLPKIGDVLLTMEAPLGEVAQITNERVALAQRLVAIRGKKGVLDNTFLKYFLRSEHGQNALRQRESGTTVLGIKQSELKKIKIPIPPFSEQRAIADILSALDDKIELNRRMNRTLEQLAQTIFKHYFMENSKQNNWEIRKVGDVCSFEYGKPMKAIDRVTGSIPVYGSNGQIGMHDEFLVEGPGIVVGRKGNPGTVTYVHTNFFPIDTTFYVVPVSTINLYWLYYSLQNLNLPNLSADSAVPGLNRNIAYMSELTIPPPELTPFFEAQIKPIFEKIFCNDSENNSLSELRDNLLPKLMSGQIRLNLGKN